MDAAHLPPAAVAGGQECAEREAAFAALRLERLRERLPQRLETGGAEILAAAHRGGFLGQRRQRLQARCRRVNSLVGVLASGADRRNEAHCESPPEREVRRQSACRFGEAELQQAVPVAIAERGLQPLRHACVERSVVLSRFEAQRAVRRQEAGERMGHRSVRIRTSRPLDLAWLTSRPPSLCLTRSARRLRDPHCAPTSEPVGRHSLLRSPRPASG